MEIVRLALSGLAVFLFPGYALLMASRRYRQAGAVEVLCAAGGLSIAVLPLLLYLCTLLGGRLTPVAAAGVSCILGGACVADLVRRSISGHPHWSREEGLYAASLALVFLMTLVARLWMVKGIAYPLWTDSYHHTLISELIARQGAVPSSYEPYAPISTFTYHFGFHTLVAWFHWLSGLSIPRSVVVVGQVVNALVVPTTYVFARRLLDSRRAALAAAVILGLLSTMPVQFVNWGRYPQLAGQILLPILIVLTIDAFESCKRSLGPGLLAGVAAAGLFLVHNRVTLFYGVFAVLLFALYAARERHQPRQAGRVLLSGLLMLTAAMLTDLPWLLRFFSGFGRTVAQQAVSGYQPATAGNYFVFTMQDLFHSGMHPVWLILAGISAAWGLLKRNRGVWLLVSWFLLLFGASYLYVIGLSPLFSPLIVAICLYLPTAIWVGYGVDRAADALASSFRPAISRAGKWGTIALAAALLSSGLFGMAYTAGVIEPDNSFVRPADLEAMQWIRENLPEDVLFHVAPYFWTPTTAHGLDAGYWIPLLADRATTIPPEVYGSDGSAAYMAATNERLRELMQATTAQQMWQVLLQNQVTHIYIGNRPTSFRPEFFDADPAHFRRVYAGDNVWIYEVIR